MFRQRLVILSIALFCAACGQLPPSPIPLATPPQDHAVVFDIDGTLTPNVFAVYEARPAAAQAVQAYADQGYQIFYLSTRTSWLSAGIPDWLAEHGFPEGSIHVAQTSGQRDHPEVYKAAQLRAFQQQGWKIDYAFGDSSTDLMAYAEVGVPPAHVFALRRRGDDACQPGAAADCLPDWVTHLPFISTSVPAVN